MAQDDTDNAKTVREDGRAGRETLPTVRDLGATVREGAATVREDAATVLESAATVRETPPSAAATEPQVAGWLPPSLATEYRVVEPLPARGSEADLYIVEPRSGEDTRRRVAKVFRHGIEPKADVLGRITTLHPRYVVQLEAFGQDAGRWWELMEYAEQGSLRMLIEREGPKLPEAVVSQILGQLNDALAGLHQLDLEHRDLKPGNVLVRRREPLELVLTDFGITSVMQATVHFTDTARTIRYAPPEAIGSIVSDEAGRRNMVVIEHTKWDYWSLGVIIVELLQGAHPYGGLSEAVIAHQLATQDTENLTKDIEDPHWRKLCRGLLRRTPAARWDFEAVAKWIADPNDPSLEVAEEAAPATSAEQPTAPSIDFDGASYATPAELGLALSKDWNKASSFWRRRYGDVVTWITDSLGMAALGEAVQRIDDANLSLDQQVFSFIYCLAPDAPLRFRDQDISAEALLALAERCANASTTPADNAERNAAETMLALYQDQIVALAADLSHAAGLSDIARAWDEMAEGFDRYREEMVDRGVPAPEAHGELFAALLAASIAPPARRFHYRDLEVSPAVLVDLAQRVIDEADPNAQELLLAVYRQNVLTLAGLLHRDAGLGELSRRWNAGLAEYEDKCHALAMRGVRVSHQHDAELALVLAASTPGTSVDRLREEASATTPDAHLCKWFAGLGTPDKMSGATLVIALGYGPEAERRGQELRASTRQWSRRRTRRACIGGCIVAGLWAPFAYSDGSAWSGAFRLVAVAFALGVVYRWVRGLSVLVGEAGDGETSTSARFFTTCFLLGIPYLFISLVVVWLWDFGIGYVATPSILVKQSLEWALGSLDEMPPIVLLLHVAIGGSIGYFIGRRPP